MSSPVLESPADLMRAIGGIKKCQDLLTHVLTDIRTTLIVFNKQILWSTVSQHQLWVSPTAQKLQKCVYTRDLAWSTTHISLDKSWTWAWKKTFGHEAAGFCKNFSTMVAPLTSAKTSTVNTFCFATRLLKSKNSSSPDVGASVLFHCGCHVVEQPVYTTLYSTSLVKNAEQIKLDWTGQRHKINMNSELIISAVFTVDMFNVTHWMEYIEAASPPLENLLFSV